MSFHVSSAIICGRRLDKASSLKTSLARAAASEWGESREAPGGYTVGVGSWSTGVVNGAIYNLNYDVVNDFEPVILLPENPLFITSKKPFRQTISASLSPG